MVATPSGADDLANTLLENLTTGVDFSLPAIDLSDPMFEQPTDEGVLYAKIEPIDFDTLTTGVVGGTGVFDKLMVSLVKHLKVEYDANRISGAEYTKAYVGIITAALQTSQQFILSKDQAYWQSLLVQAQARTADTMVIKGRIDLEIARTMLYRNQYEAATAEVNYGLTKIKISTEDVGYANLVLQGINLGKQGENIDATTSNLIKQGEGTDFTNEFILPVQKSLLEEQVEVQHAQTSTKKTDGTTNVTGLIGKQVDLYEQQIDSYKRDAETKVAKIFADAYVTQMTVLDSVTPPTQFNATNINEVLVKIKSNNNLN